MKGRDMTGDSSKPTRIAVLGLGMAGSEILRTLSGCPEVEVAAVVTSREGALAAYQNEFGGQGYRDIDALCADQSIEAVWVATPSEYHAEHAIKLANHGKHVVMEKPFATSMQQCEQMIEAAERNKVTLIAGGSHSFNPSYLSMRQIITSGRLGALAALTDWAFTSWMLGPREPHEVDPARDGGELLNQGPHPIDALRLLGGGMVRSVRGSTIDTNLRGRPCAGYFTAFLEFEDGTPATLVYNGYGYIGGWELVAWGETPQRQKAAENQYAYRRQLRESIDDEYPSRELARYGSSPGGGRRGATGWAPSSPGNVIVSCERGEIRQSENGLYVYDDDGRHDEPFTVEGDVRIQEALELRRALAGQPIFRDGRWGMATLEVVLAIAESAAQRKEVKLSSQVAVPKGF
jgi:phthalate 4,5-cis-dihydrodiol dehydrogenase